MSRIEEWVPSRIATNSALSAGAVAVGLVIGSRSYDDAYITYAFAKSLAAGEGLAWHGRSVLGTSSPFLACLLGGLESLLPIGIPIWGAIASTLAAALGAVAFAGLGRREAWPWGGIVTALFWLLWPGRYGHSGGEMALAIAAVAAAAWAFSEDHPKLAGLALGFAVLFRAEMGLAAPILALALASRDGLRRSIPAIVRAAVVSAAVVSFWAITLGLLAGTVLPRTLEAKRAQAGSALGIWNSAGVRFLGEEVSWLADASGSSIGILFALAVLGLVVSVRGRFRLGGALVLWGVSHDLLLAWIGVPRYTWYVEPFRISILVAAGMGLALPTLLPPRSVRWARAALAILALLLVGVGFDFLRRFVRSPGDARREVYLQVAGAADEYPIGTTIAGVEVGYLGFATRQPVLDLLGLVTADVPLDAVRRGDLAAVRNRLAPDLLMLPLNGGVLSEAIVGEAAAFVAAFRLDRLFLKSGPPVALYRGLGLAGRGPVIHDLLPDLAASGGKVEFRQLGNEGGVALRLSGGEIRSVALPAGAFGDLVMGVGAFGAARRIEVRLDVAGEAVRVAGFSPSATLPWRIEKFPVAADDRPRRVEFVCDGEVTSNCYVGMPHLAPPRR